MTNLAIKFKSCNLISCPWLQHTTRAILYIVQREILKYVLVAFNFNFLPFRLYLPANYYIAWQNLLLSDFQLIATCDRVGFMLLFKAERLLQDSSFVHVFVHHGFPPLEVLVHQRHAGRYNERKDRKEQGKGTTGPIRHRSSLLLRYLRNLPGNLYGLVEYAPSTQGVSKKFLSFSLIHNFAFLTK